MAKSKYIKKITDKDRAVLDMSNSCGWFTAQQAKDAFNMRSDRLNQLTKSGYLEKTRDVSTNVTAYKIADKAKNYYEHSYTATSVSHDRELSAYYINNKSDENEIVAGTTYCYMNQLDSKGAPDIVVVKTETREVVGVEVITINYRADDIQTKVDWSEQNNINVEYIKNY